MELRRSHCYRALIRQVDQTSRIHLNDFASMGAKIALLQIGALNSSHSHVLSPRHVQRQATSDDQHGYLP